MNHAAFERDGFVRLPGFAPQATCDRMLERVIEIARDRAAGGQEGGGAFVLPEANLVGQDGLPEQLASKIFKLHRDSVFEEFSRDPDVLDLVVRAPRPEARLLPLPVHLQEPRRLGPALAPGLLLLPVHPARPIIGVWLAVTEATLENGCLHVLPGSHLEPVHAHVPDARPGANLGYVEIVDHDMSGAVPVLMEPGDLLVFDSHLMHRSTDNVSDRHPGGDGVPLRPDRHGRPPPGRHQRLRDRPCLTG